MRTVQHSGHAIRVGHGAAETDCLTCGETVRAEGTTDAQAFTLMHLALVRHAVRHAE